MVPWVLLDKSYDPQQQVNMFKKAWGTFLRKKRLDVLSYLFLTCEWQFFAIFLLSIDIFSCISSHHYFFFTYCNVINMITMLKYRSPCVVLKNQKLLMRFLPVNYTFYLRSVEGFYRYLRFPFFQQL